MKLIKATRNAFNKGLATCLASTALLSLAGLCFGAELSPVVDDFNDASKNNLGIERQYVNDGLAGGGTRTEQQASEGVLYLSGTIVPPRGQPGWASSVLPLDPQGLPRDASKYEGIRLVLKISKGNMSVSANSTEVTNFDYHAAPISVTADGKFHEVKIPFDSMKRAWSEQTALNTKTLNSLSLVAYGVQRQAFAFEIDEVSFYKN